MNTDSSKVSGMKGDNEMVNFESLAELTGFPVETIKKELLIETDENGQEAISLGDLRSAMMKYLDTSAASMEATQN